MCFTGSQGSVHLKAYTHWAAGKSAGAKFTWMSLSIGRNLPTPAARMSAVGSPVCMSVSLSLCLSVSLSPSVITRHHELGLRTNISGILPTSLPELPVQLRDLRNNQRSFEINFPLFNKSTCSSYIHLCSLYAQTLLVNSIIVILFFCFQLYSKWFSPLLTIFGHKTAPCFL